MQKCLKQQSEYIDHILITSFNSWCISRLLLHCLFAMMRVYESVRWCEYEVSADVYLLSPHWFILPSVTVQSGQQILFYSNPKELIRHTTDSPAQPSQSCLWKFSWSVEYCDAGDSVLTLWSVDMSHLSCVILVILQSNVATHWEYHQLMLIPSTFTHCNDQWWGEQSFKKDSFKVLLTSELRELTWQQRIRVKLLESWMLVMRVEMSYSLFCLVNGRFNFTECQHFYTTLAELVWTDLHPTAPSTLLTNPSHFTLKQISLLSTNKKVLIKLWLLLRDEICWVQQHSDLSSHNWLLRRNVIKQIEQSFAVESGVKPVFEAVGAAADGEFL